MAQLFNAFRFLLLRLLQAALTMVVAVSLVFVAMRALPGNPLLARFGQHPDAAQMERLRKEYGWDRPVIVQLGEFFWKLATTGDLGDSIARSNVSVNQAVLIIVMPSYADPEGSALPNTNDHMTFGRLQSEIASAV